MIGKFILKIQKSNLIFLYLLLVAAVWIIYGDAIYYGYISDDFSLANMDFAKLQYKMIHGVHFRPLWHFSYIASNYFFQSSFFDHSINLILYSVAVVLAFQYSNLKVDRVKSFFVVLIWITLPWTVFPVVWISQRNDLIMYIFVFLSLLSFAKGYVVRSSIFLVLSFLGKVTSMFLPLYFIYKGIKDKNKLVIILNVSIFVLFFIFAFRGFLNNIPQTHINELSPILKLLNYFYHMIDSTVSQFFAFPFIVSWPHFIVLIISFVFAVNAFKISNRKVDDVWVIAFLLMLPTAVSSELRIVGLESFFIILTLAILLRVKKSKRCFSMFLFLYLLFNLNAIFHVKQDFKTLEYNLDNYRGVPDKGHYYNNNYYSVKRDFLIKSLKKIRNINTSN